jgi:aspartyl-tRNA(Asn)/glutamyl-tRNA(Gln) amidotransferase subunit C
MCFKEAVLKLSAMDVEHAAGLARLEITDQEKEKFVRQLNDVLLYIGSLNELDTQGVVPAAHPGGLTNVLREDEVRESLGTQEALTNAPDTRGDFFRVPKIID